MRISIVDVVPVISYSQDVVFTRTLAIPAMSPSNTGGVALSWTVTPALPNGLNISASTGVIAGTPTVVRAQATYTVLFCCSRIVPSLKLLHALCGLLRCVLQIRATNTGGSGTFGLRLTIVDRKR